jgi:hypothetical protein
MSVSPKCGNYRDLMKMANLKKEMSMNLFGFFAVTVLIRIILPGYKLRGSELIPVNNHPLTEIKQIEPII